MKKFITIFLIIIMTFMCGCSLFNDPANENFDNNNLTAVAGQDGYYVDDKLSFCAEIHGSYKANRPFTLDYENDNLRIWDNVYLYERDYFQMIVNNSSSIFYSVKDEDLEYVTIEDRFAQATIKEGASGIYKITFDLATKIFDLDYKGAITTPVYEEMDGCDVYSLASGFTPLVVNPNNSAEFMITNYTIAPDSLIFFHNHGDVHLSNYRVTLDENAQGKYASALETGEKSITFAVRGIYNLYVNKLTYEVRVELTNPLTASYSLQVYKNGEPTKLSAKSLNEPYIFNYELTIDKLKSIPIFISDGYLMYNLSVNETEYVDEDNWFTVVGTYSLEINLQYFTITVTYLPQ